MKKFFEREFLLSLIPIGMSVYGMAMGSIDPNISLAVSGAIAGLWIAFRQIAKITKTKKDDQFVADIDAGIGKTK